MAEEIPSDEHPTSRLGVNDESPANGETAADDTADRSVPVQAGRADPAESGSAESGPAGEDTSAEPAVAGGPPAGTVLHGQDPDDPAFPGGNQYEPPAEPQSGGPRPGSYPGPGFVGSPSYGTSPGYAGAPPYAQRPYATPPGGPEYQTPTGPPPSGPPPAPPGPSDPWPTGGGRGGRRSGVLLAVVILVAGLVGGGVGAAVDRAFLGQRTVVSSLASPPLPAQNNSAEPAGSVQQVAATVLPSVVSIVVDSGAQQDEGSGVVLTSDGLILTNNHVVAGAVQNSAQMTIQLHDGRTTSAQIVGRDPISDLAVIRATGVDNLHPATFGRSADLKVGQEVVAIGSPLGLSGTVTFGIVSALNRPVRTSNDAAASSSIDTVIDAIQTDAAINPGNSGGALVNMSGEVVGINSAIASIGSDQLGSGGGQPGSIGLGFAIPSDEAQPIAQQLAQTGQATHAQLDVRVGNAANGAQLVDVTAGGPAAHAGLQDGDVVTRVDDRPIDGADALVAAIRSHRPGDTVTLTYLRNGRTATATVTLGSQKSSAN